MGPSFSNLDSLIILNYPAFGAIAAVIVLYILDRKPSRHKDLPILEKLVRLDPLGASLLTSSLTCLFLALQWGGNQLPWSSPKVWGCLLGFGVLTILFIVLQAIRGEKYESPLFCRNSILIRNVH